MYVTLPPLLLKALLTDIVGWTRSVAIVERQVKTAALAAVNHAGLRRLIFFAT